MKMKNKKRRDEMMSKYKVSFKKCREGAAKVDAMCSKRSGPGGNNA